MTGTTLVLKLGDAVPGCRGRDHAGSLPPRRQPLPISSRRNSDGTGTRRPRPRGGRQPRRHWALFATCVSHSVTLSTRKRALPSDSSASLFFRAFGSGPGDAQRPAAAAAARRGLALYQLDMACFAAGRRGREVRRVDRTAFIRPIALRNRIVCLLASGSRSMRRTRPREIDGACKKSTGRSLSDRHAKMHSRSTTVSEKRTLPGGHPEAALQEASGCGELAGILIARRTRVSGCRRKTKR